MPYGVRVKMKGRLVVIPFGVKIQVWSLTPSRIGIIASVESNAEPGAAAGACAGAARPAAEKRTRRRPVRRRTDRVIGRLSLSLARDVVLGDGLPGVPDAALAVLRDDPGEPGGGVPPVGLHRVLGRRRVAPGDGPHDHSVLPDRGPHLVGEGAHVEPGVALPLGLAGLVEGAAAG